jgi:hypothetical protein
MESVQGEESVAFPAVQEYGPWYDAGDGPDSRKRYSSYPFMFQPTLEALVDEYNEMVAKDECVPTRFNTDGADGLVESIDKKIASLRAFYDHDELSAEVQADEKECKLSLRFFSRAEEQERLARLKEAAEDDERCIRTACKGRSRAFLATQLEREKFLNMPIVLEPEDETIPADEIHDCDRTHCPVCAFGVRVPAKMEAALKSKVRIPMPQWSVVDFDFNYNDSGDDLGEASAVRKAKRSISKLLEMRNSIAYVVNFQENPLAKIRRLVRDNVNENDDAEMS